jgi:uncharacterized protein (DUF362 family)
MPLTHHHPVYSRDSKVYILTGEDKFETFGRIIDRSGFIDHLTDHLNRSAKSKDAFTVAVKPNIMTASIHETDSPVYTDPALVEALIERMRLEGFSRFVVVESQNVYNYSYTNRSVGEVSAMCGYTGNGYEIVDLTADVVPFDYGSVLGEHTVGRAWLEADYRISFAKNKTHWQCFYTACMKNVYGCLPEWDKMKHYHGKGIEFFQSTVLICDKIPVHFGFLDAWTSGDGLTGHVRDANPNRTRTFFASDNIYALDWVAGEKMQVNPAENYVIQEAMHRWGTIRISRAGNMSPWYPWRNVRPFVVIALNIMEEFYHISKFFSRAMASRMDKRFTPVSKGQWFFGIAQALTRIIENIFTRKTDPEKERSIPA